MVNDVNFKTGEDHLIGMVFYRKISLPFVYLCVRFKVKPDIVTTFGLLAAVVAVLFLLSHKFFWAMILWQFSIICDFSDGMVARQNEESSAFGDWYDYVIDRASRFILLCGMGLVVGYPFGWIAATLAVGLSHVTDVAILKSRLVNLDKENVGIAGSGKQGGKKTNSNNFLKWLIVNFVLIHGHIWGFIGFFILLGISGIWIALVLMNVILFLNVLYQFKNQYQKRS